MNLKCGGCCGSVLLTSGDDKAGAGGSGGVGEGAFLGDLEGVVGVHLGVQ